MNKRSASALIGGVACALILLGDRDAAACGGCFQQPPRPTQTVSDITDERMLLSVSQTQTTLFDQIRYAGNPGSFAWVLPIKGTVDVGLSADVMFVTIDALTTTQITGPQLNCPPPPNCGGSFASGFSNASGGGADGQNTVTVTKQQNVGPYETVQLHSSDPNALNAWLAQNDFQVPSDVAPIIDAYVQEGFDFLAMKLLPDEGIQSMRPVRVTMPGSSLTLPLRMAAVGTGGTVGITIWVLAEGRYEPQNFPSFHVDDSQLIWDWNVNASNYTTLRVLEEAPFFGRGWEIESSIDLNTQTISNAIWNGGTIASGTSANEGLGGPLPTGDNDDYLPIGSPPNDAGANDGGNSDAGDGGAYESANDVRDDDLNALLAGASNGTVRVTRMRSDLSHAAMSTDFILRASEDQTELSNDRVVTHQINVPACPSYSSCGIFDCDTSTSRPILGGTGVIATAFALLGLIFMRARR